VLWAITPYSDLEVSRRLGGICRFFLAACLLPTVRFSETSADFQLTARHCFPEDGILYNYLRVSLRILCGIILNWPSAPILVTLVMVIRSSETSDGIFHSHRRENLES
jgi:hypothetical protein